MRQIADLHIHSKYSRACSKELTPGHLDAWARIKGISILGSSDFTHPAWLKELKQSLVPDKPGLLKLKGSDGKVKFMLSTELSCIYTQGGQARRVHHCVFAPDFTTVDKIIAALEGRGCNLRADGRPILGLSSIELAKIVFDAHPDSMIIPAHAWTPWFAIFGSKSGFDTIQECFGEFTKEIFAIETGLSSDPAMNWRLSQLDNITQISNSDAHSLPNLGREGNAIDIEESNVSYAEVRRILKEKDKKKFLYTIEFFPEEGKYHCDGHRDCNVVLTPAESKKLDKRCPKCKKPLTIGVLHRVDDLADRPVGFKPDTIPFKSIVPLQEIIAEALDVGKQSKKVQALYHAMVQKGESEFSILLDASAAELASLAPPEIVAGILNVRAGSVEVQPGYDGVYGVVKAFGKQGIQKPKQSSLL